MPLEVRHERITIEELAGLLGVPIRTVQAMAARGEIPSAAKFGRRWTFDEARIRVWIKDREGEICRERAKTDATSIGEAASGGHGSRSMGPSVEGAYERTMRWLRSGGLRNGANAR